MPSSLETSFEFDLTVEAAKKNYIILMHKFGGCLQQALDAQWGLPLQYGLEFQPVLMMEQIFHNHPCWAKMKELLLQGSWWALSPLSDKKRLLDIENALEFGNHKGANQQLELLTTLIQDNVDRGFALPLPLNKLKKVPGVLLGLLNIQLQKTIKERGKNT